MPVLEAIIDDLLTSRKLPYPRVVSIEPVGNLCQLKCPLCPVGAQLLPQDSRFMSLETFRTLLDKMPFVSGIDLYRSGEPFFNPDLFAMIRHASQKNVMVTVSTNFSFSRPDTFFEELVGSGLESLIISLDGASQETYARYRVGGDFQLVLANIRKLVDARARLGSKKPAITWQFLVNRYNEPEIDTARRMARELGIALDLRPISLADNEPDVPEHPESIEQRKETWLPVNEAYISDCYKGEYRYPLAPGICRELFTRPVVTVDGKLLPCCEAWDDHSSFGDLLEAESFDAIWYNRTYRDARYRFLKRDFTPEVKSVCFACNNFDTAPSLGEKLRLLKEVYRKSIGHWVKSLFRMG